MAVAALGPTRFGAVGLTGKCVYSPTSVNRETWLGWFSVAIAVVCATVVTVTAVALAMPSVRRSLGPAPASRPPSYRVGQSVDLPAEVYERAPNTVAIFFRSDCGACERLKPFLTRLAARQQTTLQVVAVTGVANPTDSLAFARQIGLDRPQLITMDMNGLRVSRVPTVVLIDRAGSVHAAIEGLPTLEEEEDLLRMVTSLSAGH
jgi:hypothetical protein